MHGQYDHCMYVFRSIIFFSLVEKMTPLGKKIYQSKRQVKKQLDPDRVRTRAQTSTQWG